MPPDSIELPAFTPAAKLLVPAVFFCISAVNTALPTTVTVDAKFAAPPTLRAPAILTAPPIVVVPPTVKLPTKIELPETHTSSSNSALPTTVSVPPTPRLAVKVVLPTIVAVPPTYKFPPMVALPTDIFPSIAMGTLVRLAPSP